MNFLRELEINNLPKILSSQIFTGKAKNVGDAGHRRGFLTQLEEYLTSKMGRLFFAKSLNKKLMLNIGFLTIFSQLIFAQTPFTNERRTFLIIENSGTNQFAELTINPQNSAISTSLINNNLNANINAIGFRSTDNFLYGINQNTLNLIRIDATGQIDVLTTLNINLNNLYLAGDVSPDGKYLTIIGSDDGNDQELIHIDLESPTFDIQVINLAGGTFFADIVYNPFNGDLYGFDKENNGLAKINGSNITGFPPMAPDKEVYGLYYDAFGTLFGYGNALNGVTNALYIFDPSNGSSTQVTTGAPSIAADVAGCPYAIQINNDALPNSSFPCTELVFAYAIANGSSQTIFNTQIEHQLPPGFTFLEVLQNDLSGTVDMAAPPEIFRLNDVTIPPGVFDLEISVEIGDIAGGEYNSQATINDLPILFGETLLSNDPETIRELDSTEVEVIRIDEDSLFFSNLVCEDEELIIDASTYGNNVVWNDGSTDLEQIVTNEGVYFFESSTSCQSVVVTYDVTFASCPFTVELGLRIFPKITLPCSEVFFTYIIENSSGGERTNVFLKDELPEGFEVVTLLSNPFIGIWNQADPNVVLIEGMNIPLGTDSIQFLIKIGNIPPKEYQNVGILGNLPPEIGTFRISDDPSTQLIDSSRIEVLGVETDSFYIEEYLCPDEIITLDGSDFGIGHLWDNGSTETSIEVSEPGQYNLTVFDGCEPTYIFYTVAPAPDLWADFDKESITIIQGKSAILAPNITNLGNDLSISWQDEEGLIDCDLCPELEVSPFESTTYQINIANETCLDSAAIFINVDIVRRIFAPNVFSPNGDGINDIFYIQSPDYGILKELIIFDRWGGEVYQSKDAQLNTPQNGWGTQTLNLRPDVYLWRAQIEFIDGSVDYFYGNVALIK